MAYYDQSKPQPEKVGILTQDYDREVTTLDVGAHRTKWRGCKHPYESVDALRKAHGLTGVSFRVIR